MLADKRPCDDEEPGIAYQAVRLSRNLPLHCSLVNVAMLESCLGALGEGAASIGSIRQDSQ